MKFTSTVISSVFVVAVAAVPLQQRPSRAQKRLVDASLVPSFGVTPGIKDPAGSASCVGINNILIPCTCPPDSTTFINALSANVAAGHDVNNTGVGAPFPTDDSAASQIVRLQTSVTTLQNLHGAGVGCPASSTTFLAQIAALQSGSTKAATTEAATTTKAAATKAAATKAAPAATTAAAAVASGTLVDASLVPSFGVTPGIKDPAGSASCVGINNILIPCTCPPDSATFIKALSANVAAGHDVNNTGVGAPFPTDDSTASQIVRLQTSVTTLQNLHGAGVGCPASSTTFLAQIAALQAKT
ncbi:hypothetical protein DFH07DRAFT_915920 [Mycena maculata]|uniref:Uncharacterized protein n=1 Tax=Mycena maculata TaxID=230809 RepID=A0AAD7NMB6_9AGAR|nr:hypothetical protein DFH07DRAFT_915920 [Mycena maculata]